MIDGEDPNTRTYIFDNANNPADCFRPNDNGTVTYISPTGGEHTYDPDDLFKQGD